MTGLTIVGMWVTINAHRKSVLYWYYKSDKNVTIPMLYIYTCIVKKVKWAGHRVLKVLGEYLTVTNMLSSFYQ